MMEKDLDARGLFGQFSNDTSLHGIKHITGDSKGKRRVFWILALFIMLVLLIYVVLNQVLKITSYPFYTVSTLRQTHELPFPSVTICNSNMFRKSFLANDTITQMALRAIYDDGPLRPTVNFTDPNMTSQNTECDPTAFFRNSAHQLETMFRHCTWASQTVNCSKYLTPSQTNHGVCYTFNSQEFIDKEGRLNSTFPGEEGGLSLVIDIEEHEYFYGASSGTGVKVLVHEPSVFPNKGFLVAPGTKVSAGMSVTRIMCLPRPFKAMGTQYCLDTDAPGFKVPLDFFHTYDMQTCYMECAAKYAINKCGCQQGSDNAVNVSYCSLRQLIQCYKPTQAEHRLNVTLIEECGCLRQCRWNQYDVTVSSGGYPVEHDTQQFMDNRNISREYVLKNYLEVSVFYEQLVFIKIEQVPAYTTVDVVANLGGQLGIFLGASFLTLTEVAEYIFGAVLVMCHKRKKTTVQAWTAEKVVKPLETTNS